MPAPPAYSYRSDPEVPAFDDDHPIIVYDNICVLCSGFVHWVLRRDRGALFRFLSAQSPLGEALYRHYGLKRGDYETNLLIADGHIYGKSEAYFQITRRFGGFWPLLLAGRVVPRPLRDWLYDRVARNRYRLFGKRDTCLMPSPDVAERFIG